MQTIESSIPSPFAFFSMPDMDNTLSYCTRHWEYVDFGPTADSMRVRAHYQATTVAENHWYCRRLILNYFLGRSHSHSYRYPCSAERMMQKLGEYSIAHAILRGACSCHAWSQGARGQKLLNRFWYSPQNVSFSGTESHMRLNYLSLNSFHFLESLNWTSTTSSDDISAKY